MRTNGEIITQFLVRNNYTTTDTFFTDSTIQTWLKDAHTWAAAYKKWPFTEGRISTTYAGAEELSIEGYKADSIRFLKVGSDLFQKVDFRSYQEMKQDTPDSTQKVYTDFGRTILINNMSNASGTLTAYGQYLPVLDVTDLTATTIFTDFDDEGNEGIFHKMTSYAKQREHLDGEATTQDQKAMEKLDGVFERVSGEQFAYQNRSGDGMFKRFDVLNGGFIDDSFNTDQF